MQMKRLGWAIDWDREVSAHEVGFYHWTQWLFLRFFERDLAYRKAAPVNWCPNDQTVVANEHVVDGRCWRCGGLVEARNLEQWFFRITAYADELLEYDLPEGAGGWPERTKTIQRNWIGRSEGAEVLFRIEELDADVPVFTTRPDTLFGATFFVLAPEHPLVERIDSDEVQAYAKQTAARRGEERATEEEKTGVFTGLHAINPVNGERLPVYVADYVLMEYGTGAIMAVPAHDERDREFAEAFGLPIIEVVTEDGVLVNSRRRTTGSPPTRAGRRSSNRWRRKAEGEAGRVVPPPRLELLAATLLGCPDSHRLLRRLRSRPFARRRATAAATGGRGLPAEGGPAARVQRGVDQRALPVLREAGPA